MSIKKDNFENYNVVCPQCSESLFKKNNINSNTDINNKNNNSGEFLLFKCKKCNIVFCYILCVYCDKKIYMKIHPKCLPYNGLNGFNIYCPYETCRKIFYFTKCIKCQRIQKQKACIKEGSIITCEYDDCKCEYIQISCPIKMCGDINSCEKPKIFTNFPMGCMNIHNQEVMFQKIACYYCWRPIVYLSNRAKKNKYIECQKIECPYSNCKKIFNRIICPHCYYENYIEGGWYKMGSRLKCHKCKEYFGKIICPCCQKINVCENNYFRTGKMKCGIINCLKENYLINCLYCSKLNIFNNKAPINGQTIKCGYCYNIFNEVFCPFCRLINPFPLADFSFGKVYKCKYLNCLKEFQYLICPNCFLYTFTKENQEGKKLKCDECNILFMNWGCPFCKSNIMDKKSILHLGQMVKCPAKECGKIYSFLKCPKCKKLVFSKENEILLGKSVKCPYQGCGEYFLIIICPLCKIKAVYSGQKIDYEEGKNIYCPNCKGNFKFIVDKKIYDNKLTILEQIVGNTLKFGDGIVDENYLFKQNLFFIQIKKKIFPSQFASVPFDKNLIKLSNHNILLGDCIVCHNNVKESIFYPCAHRCVCYNCAVLVFEMNKKCPKCNQPAKCIIKKVYE